MPKRKSDANTDAAKLVKKVTGTTIPKGEDLLGSDELKRQLREAKDKNGVKQKHCGD